MKVEILDEAQEDLLDGFRFYECQSEGLGDYFLDFLFSDMTPCRFTPASTQCISAITGFSPTIPFRHLLSLGPQDRSSSCHS